MIRKYKDHTALNKLEKVTWLAKYEAWKPFHHFVYNNLWNALEWTNIRGKHGGVWVKLKSGEMEENEE